MEKMTLYMCACMYEHKILWKLFMGNMNVQSIIVGEKSEEYNKKTSDAEKFLGVLMWERETCFKLCKWWE